MRSLFCFFKENINDSEANRPEICPNERGIGTGHWTGAVIMQMSLWKEEIRENPKKKTFAQKVMESKAIYRLGCDSNIDKSVLLIALLGKLSDETLLILLSKKLTELAEMSREELLQIKGITPNLAARIISVFQINKMMECEKQGERKTINSPDDAATLVMDEMRYLDREQFRVMHLNTKNQVIYVETVSVGGLSSSIVHPRETFKNAIKRSSAHLILVHNHPSGDPAPSQEDIKVTKKMVEAGEVIGITVLDHIVIGNNRYFSFKAKNLM